MKNIAIFINDLSLGGIQKSVINLIKNIDKTKYNIDLYVFNNNNFFKEDLNVNIIYLSPAPYILKFIPFKLAYKLYNENINKEYDISIDYDSYQMHTSILALKTKAKKHIIWIHNDILIKLKEEIKYKILHFFFKEKYKYFDTFVSVSVGALESFKEKYNFKDKVYLTIPNFIDTLEIENKLKEKSNLKIDKNKLNIVTVGRLCHQKGIDLMLKDISILTKYRTDFHLYIIGDGKDKRKLIKLKNKLNLDNYVTFLGSTNNPFKYMKVMDLFYLRSRYEGQGMVILEALFVGLDVLIPKHLEKYCNLVKGQIDTVEYLKKYKKKTKRESNKLDEYNKSIKEKLDNLFSN